MAETNFENATLKLLIEDTDGIVTVASLQQTPATPSGDGIGGSIADKQIAFGNGTDIAGNAQLLFEKSGNFYTVLLGSLELDWDDDAGEATIYSSSLILKGASISLGDTQNPFAGSGIIRLQKNCSIKARNSANDGDIYVLRLANNAIQIGSDSDFFTVSAGGANMLTAADVTISAGGLVNVFGVAIFYNGIQGTTTNDNATALNVGEEVQSLKDSAHTVSLSTNTEANITNITLSAGDWDVEGNVNFIETTSTVTARVAGIGLTAAVPTDGSEVYCGVQSVLTTEKNSITLPRKRVSIAEPTTISLMAMATFSAGTCAGFGAITARRVR